MRHEPEKARLTQQWMTKAARDLASAERSALPPALGDIAVYHCQQAVEKALKAYLTWHDVPLRRTHDLVALLTECEASDVTFTQLRDVARTLTPYATEFRYPGPATEPSTPEVYEALQYAHVGVTFVLTRLPTRAKP